MKDLAGPGSTCARCLLVRGLCLCAEIPVVTIATQFVIVRHASERTRSSNTGRLAALALPNAVLIDVDDHHDPGRIAGALPELEALPPARSWLLYPEGEARTVAPVPPPERVIVLDGTWVQTRKLRRRLHALRGLPPLRLGEGPMAQARLRASPAPGMVSTIEAIAACVRLLDGDAPARQLEALFATAVDRARRSGRTGAVAR